MVSICEVPSALPPLVMTIYFFVTKILNRFFSHFSVEKNQKSKKSVEKKLDFSTDFWKSIMISVMTFPCIQILSPTHFVSNISHQHRCNRLVYIGFELTRRSAGIKAQGKIVSQLNQSHLSQQVAKRRKLWRLFDHRKVSFDDQ